MTFAAAAALVPMLARLGIGHLYTSPIFAAVPGSPHGYDVISFGEIDASLGGAEGFSSLADACRAAGLGLIVDFVPNHMGATAFNPWWRDVLEWGGRSAFADFFDVDWNAEKLIVPVLAEPYGDALASGKLSLQFDSHLGVISLAYGGTTLPLTPPSYAAILRHIEAAPFPELARRFAGVQADVADAARQALLDGAKSVGRGAVDAALATVAADAGALHALLEAQPWRIAYWRTAREDLTYRRFFEIAELVGLRVERPPVFDKVHATLAGLVTSGQIDGLRLDHIDGLADPRGYLEGLQGAITTGADQPPAYLVVEKIVGSGEELPPDWPVAGTTGYEFIKLTADLLVGPAGERELSEAYESFIGAEIDYGDMVAGAKRFILGRNLAGEMEHLRDAARALAARSPATRDLGPDTLRRAILEVAAALPVYRTYVSLRGPGAVDLVLLEQAIAAAKASREVEDEGAIDFVGRLLRLDFPDPSDQSAALQFTTRFQQTTGAVMAKAVEDTVFYRYNRLIGLNEVGGDARSFGAPPSAFHAAMQRRQATQPFGLSATATHDTKRGEDSRARLYAISEAPASWRDAVGRWSRLLASHRTPVDGREAPEPEIEWLFYQSLFGAWPAEIGSSVSLPPDFRDRLQEYMRKVVREAKQHTSWTSANSTYEAALVRFVDAALADPEFRADFTATIQPFLIAGALNGLTQLAIKLTAPGVPDIYQGSEFWDLNLVDPDNRRPVDFAARQNALDVAEHADPGELLADWRSAKVKLRLMRAGLHLRRRRPELFAEGVYEPLLAEGERAENVVAFARRRGAQTVVTIAPRLALPMLQGEDRPIVPTTLWHGTTLHSPPDLQGRFRDVVTGAELSLGDTTPIADLLGAFSVAVLESAST